MEEFVNSDLFRYLVLPLLIFASRLLDVPLSTIRIMFMSKGRKFLAPLFGFFEVLIWVIAISQIMQHLDNVLAYLAYAGGFALGNYIGIRLEEKLALGIYMVRIILTQDDNKMMERISNEGFGVTKVMGVGTNGPVDIIYTVIRRKDLERLVNIIHQCSEKAFYSIEEARTAYAGVFPSRKEIKKEVNEASGAKNSRFSLAYRKRK
ncbi:MAG: DUF2179 domain-containing protein [Eubacteriales bacterium]|nr:DUF2179 domain-containing protein [Eubacteriales bacterium]